MTHTVFTVRLAAHETDPDRVAWRLRHAGETFSLICAWLAEAPNPDGTYDIHAPSRETLTTARQMIGHEEMELISERQGESYGVLQRAVSGSAAQIATAPDGGSTGARRPVSF